MTPTTQSAGMPGGYERERVATRDPQSGRPLAHARSYRILVLGLGNDILTDDAVGLLVARAVAERVGEEREIAVRETIEMGLALLDEIADFDALILVDSVQTGRAPPGHIHECDIADLPQVTATSPHFVGVGETLALGRRLGLAMPRRVRVIAIEVADPFTLGTQPTTVVQEAVGLAVERVVALTRTWTESWAGL